MKIGLVFIVLLSSLLGFRFKSNDYDIKKDGVFQSNKDDKFLCVDTNNMFTVISDPIPLIGIVHDKLGLGTKYNPNDMVLGYYKNNNNNNNNNKQSYDFNSTDEIKIIIYYKGSRNLDIDTEVLFKKLSIKDKEKCHNQSDYVKSLIESKPKPIVKSKPKPIVKSKPKPIVKSKPKPIVKSKPKPIVKSKPKPKPIDKTKPKNYNQDVMVYVKVASSINSKKQQLIIKELNQYIHNRKYRYVYLTFSEKYKDIKYEGNDSALTHLYKADNASVRRDRNYEFDIPAMLETDTKIYKDIIVFDYLTSCRNNYASNVTIVNIDDNTCDKKIEDRIIDLMNSNE